MLWGDVFRVARLQRLEREYRNNGRFRILRRKLSRKAEQLTSGNLVLFTGAGVSLLCVLHVAAKRSAKRIGRLGYGALLTDEVQKVVGL